jgi:HlyD family secretion protein
MKKLIFAIIGVLVVISGVLIYKKLHPKKLPPYLVEAVGRIDGDLIALNTKYPGRVEKINVDSGDKVLRGEVVAFLNSKEFEDKLEAIEAEIEAKRDELNFTTSKILNTIKKAKLNIKAKEAQIKEIEAEIEALREVIRQDKRDEVRIAKLVKKNLAKHHELEMAKLKTKTDIDKLKALLAKKEALEVALEVAKKDLEVAKASKANINALKNSIKALLAKKAEIKTIISELTIKSPIDGFVDTKVAHKGEVVGAGGVLALLIDPKSYYLKIYVDELTNGKIKLSQKAEIFLDAFPNRPIKAVVSKIAKRAEFTPKEVAVRSDRITRVYEVHLKPLENFPYLKLGLPAIGVILIGNGTLPKSLDEIPVM